MAAPQLKTYFKKFKSDHLGQIQLTGIVNIRNFDTVNLEVTNWPDPIPNLTVAVHMGKISGATRSGDRPLLLGRTRPHPHLQRGRPGPCRLDSGSASQG